MAVVVGRTSAPVLTRASGVILAIGVRRESIAIGQCARKRRVRLCVRRAQTARQTLQRRTLRALMSSSGRARQGFKQRWRFDAADSCWLGGVGNLERAREQASHMAERYREVPLVLVDR